MLDERVVGTVVEMSCNVVHELFPTDWWLCVQVQSRKWPRCAYLRPGHAHKDMREFSRLLEERSMEDLSLSKESRRNDKLQTTLTNYECMFSAKGSRPMSKDMSKCFPVPSRIISVLLGSSFNPCCLSIRPSWW